MHPPLSLTLRSAASAVPRLPQLPALSGLSLPFPPLGSSSPRDCTALGSFSQRDRLGRFPVCLLGFKLGYWKGNAGNDLDSIFSSQTASFHSFLASVYYR